jgi:hypothetical protein
VKLGLFNPHTFNQYIINGDNVGMQNKKNINKEAETPF